MRHVIVGAETIVISQVHQGFLKHSTIASWTSRGFGQQVVCDLRIASRNAIQQPIEWYLCCVRRAGFT